MRNTSAASPVDAALVSVSAHAWRPGYARVMKTALERSQDPDADTRYLAVLELANEPSAEAAARLVALLSDETEVCTDEGMSTFDVDPTYRPVNGVARDALCRMGEWAWPAMAAAWPSASVSTRRAMITALKAQPFGARARFPDEAHAAIEAEAREVGHASVIAEVTWERGFAARVRSGALADPEAFWRAAHDHPNPVERDRSFTHLAAVVTDPVALAHELFALLPRKDVWQNSVIAALVRLPAVMPASLVEAMVSSDILRAHPETWAWLASHGDAARGLVAVCVDALAPSRVGRDPVWIPTDRDERRWRLATEALRKFGPLAPEVRATLLERLATTNETMSLQGSLRRWLVELLGDPAQVESELGPRLDEMAASGDPVAVARAQQLRHRFEVYRRPR